MDIMVVLWTYASWLLGLGSCALAFFGIILKPDYGKETQTVFHIHSCFQKYKQSLLLTEH